MFTRTVWIGAALIVLSALAAPVFAAEAPRPASWRDPSKKGTPLTAEETKWLKELTDAEKEAAKRKEIEKEFKAGSGLGRIVLYRTFKKDEPDDSGKRGGPLSAKEARWLQEIMDTERDPARKKEIEEEYRAEASLGRAAIYKLFTKDRPR